MKWVLVVLTVCAVEGANLLRGKVAAAEEKTHFQEEIAGVVHEVQKAPARSGGLRMDLIGPIIQMIFGVAYWFIVVSKYPKLEDSTPTEKGKEEAKHQQELDPVSSCFQSTCANAFLGCFCMGPRAAHTFHSAGVPKQLGAWTYWPMCCLMSFPWVNCCLLWLIHSFTDLQEKLQAQKRNCCMAFICAWTCCCCLVIQDAQSLDSLLDVKTSCCSISTANDEKVAAPLADEKSY